MRIPDGDAIKRALDVSVAAVALLLLAPVFLVTALGVLIALGRPVLFRQQRPGLHGVPFQLVKFRTMKNPLRSDRIYPRDDELRLTRFGSLLRASSLDELPQLWNIVRGDMSFVGPRPLLMQYLSRYSERQGKRHLVRPGLTGWAQVHGRNELSWDAKLELDVWYVENRSLRLDLKILALTILRVLRRSGITGLDSATMTEFQGPEPTKLITEDRGSSQIAEGAKLQSEPNHLLNDDQWTDPKRFAYAADEGWPHYEQDEIDAVSATLRSGRVNQWTGEDVAAFERACRQRFGGGPGLAVANGSVALELALRALNIGPGDEVVVTPRSFVASASCVRLVGATPVFADVELDSGNISASTIQWVLSARTKAIIAVHLAGWPCDIPAIMDLARKQGISVIEDCAQAHGATIDGRPVGSFGDVACFSFCQDKIISTAGEGGYVSFQDEEKFEWAWSYKDHGKNKRKLSFPSNGSFRCIHDMIGTNWRMTGPQAALGVAQLGKLDNWLRLRTMNAGIWTRALENVPGLRIPHPEARFRHAYYKYYFYVDAESDSPKIRQEIIDSATGSGLRIFAGSCPEIYLERAFNDLPQPNCPRARQLGESSLMVEVHPTLRPESTEKRAQWLATVVRSALGG